MDVLHPLHGTRHLWHWAGASAAAAVLRRRPVLQAEAKVKEAKAGSRRGRSPGGGGLEGFLAESWALNWVHFRGVVLFF